MAPAGAGGSEGDAGPAAPADPEDNARVADALASHGRRLEEAGAPGYRSRAYVRAAETVAALDVPVRSVTDLRRLPGIGNSIARAIHEILEGTWQPETPVDEPMDEAATRLMTTLRGDLHAHTVATDGRNTIEEMATAARTRGYEYLAITDHSHETRIAGGLSPERMRVHVRRIRRADEQLEGITLLAGAEVDILRDGRLDFPDDLLAELDVVLCSVHFRHGLSGREQTERILKAMTNEHADILAHPTTRRKGIRPGLDLDLDRIAQAAADQGWAIELNGSPERRDLCAEDAQRVLEHDVMLSLDSDAHATRELRNVRYSCIEAAAAGVDAGRVLNALPLAEFRRRLRSS